MLQLTSCQGTTFGRCPYFLLPELPAGLDCTALVVKSFSKSLQMDCSYSASFALQVPST